MTRFSLLTFNLLAPCYFRHAGRVESSDRGAFLARAHAAIRAIRRQNCDLVCLQEYWFHREYQAAFRHAFHWTHSLHSIKRPGPKEDGLAVFVDKSKFDIHHVQGVQLDQSGDRVALLMHLATKWNREDLPLNQRSFLLINSHLTFPHSDLYRERRLGQLNHVLDAVHTFVDREKLDNVPILMCGDFNDYNDPVYQQMTGNGFSSVYQYVHGREARITHCNHKNREVGVDFIFVSELEAALRAAKADPNPPVPSATITSEKRTEHAASLGLLPTESYLVPRNMGDNARMKRPSFGQDWNEVRHPADMGLYDEDALVNYWRMVSDHRPLVAKFNVVQSSRSWR